MMTRRRTRVRKARLSIDYVRLMHSKAFEVRDGSYAPADLEELKENFQSFMKDVRSFGITELHEGMQAGRRRRRIQQVRINPIVWRHWRTRLLRVEVAAGTERPASSE